MRSSDEGDPYRDGRRLCPVLRGLMGHYMIHHCVFGHMFNKVRLLEKTRIEANFQTFPLQLVHICYLTRLGFLTHRRVRLAAHAAAVGLGIFYCVCRQVDLQRGRV